MPRLRNAQTGAVVSCGEETARRLGSEWQPAEKPQAPAEEPTAPARSRRSSKSDE